ncbi:unnamed protein product [Eruca vesicaria subsp. sativa]|uniref:DUF7725 domain-containing protein n=1 Tax=Eruca vesicaria subsp. sativa TaxID=29727 RepID=A0ABC8JYA1_ERUVS|nr:unnamed protein product [Eruca vesicaria subsp. sativa]
METLVTRGGSLQNNHSRKEWRAVYPPNQTEPRAIYENGRDGELLEQIRSVSRQKGELQKQEVELRARVLAMEIQRGFESRSVEYENAAARLQEQLREKERAVREMERKLEGKDRELHAAKLDNQAAWANEGLLREQNKELATLRRERDHFEAERSQSIHKISELQEHIQEKERLYSELEEQNRIAQETSMYKDEQLRELHGWIARAQEMDALQSSTNLSLQAELRERTEQYNQLWHGCQRQFAELERLHQHTMQQLQHELANLKEGGGGSKTNFNGASQMNPLHSFVMHQQKAISEMPRQNHVHPPQGIHHALVSSDARSEHQMPANGQSLGQGYLDVQTSYGGQYRSATPLSLVNEQVVESSNGSNTSENNFQDISSQFRDVLRLDSNALNQKPNEANGQISPGEQNGVVPETLVSSGKAERNVESALLDERSLLACIVRTIPAGERIRISSTLHNRLGKMIAPLQWHDYKKKYGELGDFVASHLELFTIEGDYIQAREGAQKMVAASVSAAAGKVAASSSPNSMYVAITPMAQSQNDKTVQRGRQSSSDYMAPQQRKL